MKVTEEYIKERFGELNRMIFKGRLPDIPVKLTNAKTYAGMVCYKRQIGSDRKWHYSDFSMRWSNLLDRSADAIDDILLHEMIHLLILHNQMTDTAPHGQMFRSLMEKINREWGRHITISERITSKGRNEDTRRRNHIIGIVTFKDGNRGLMVPSITKFREISAVVNAHPTVEQVRWYSTRNPYFNRYPHTRTARIFRLPPDMPEM